MRPEHGTPRSLRLLPPAVPDSLARPLSVYLASRLVVLVAVFLAAGIVSFHHDDLTGRPWPTLPPTDNLTLRALGSWDGAWYLQVARDGYPPEVDDLARQLEHPDAPANSPRAPHGFAFFPLFPLAVRAGTAVTGLSPLATGVVLATAFGAVAAVLLWQLVRELSDPDVADRTVALFSFFPGSLVLSMPYAESLMLALALACFLALHRQRWLAAGVAAGLATATRPNAVALCLCCAWSAAVAVGKDRRWVALVAPVLSLTGIGGYFAFLAERTGDPLAWFRVQRVAWFERVDLGVVGRRTGTVLGDLFGGLARPLNANDLVTTAGLLFAVVTLVALWRWRQPAIFVVYTVVVLVMALLSRTLGLRPRFVLTAFPLLAALALHLRGLAFRVWLGVSAGLLAAYAILSVTTTVVTP